MKTVPTDIRPTLGVVGIAKNEEQDLPGFLEHLLPWVDEIVLVDDHSTDRTQELARAAGPKVRLVLGRRDAETGYAGQRNRGIAAATADWLLHMDIDERVPPDLAREILAAIADPAKDAYRYRRLNFFLGHPMRGGGLQNWNKVQLARRPLARFEGVIHETLKVAARPERIGQLQAPMWHLNDADYAERLRKSMEYCQTEAARMGQRGKRVHAVRLVAEPLWVLVRTLVRDGGWRDGMPGLAWALHCADAHLRTLLCGWSASHTVPRAKLETELRRLETAAAVRPGARAERGRAEPGP